VDDPLLVRGGQRLGDGHREVPQHLERHATGRDQRIQRLALDQLHREERRRTDLLDGMNGDDVRMVQRGNRVGLALEAAPVVLVVGLQDLQRDVALQPAVVGAIDLAHPAGAEQGEDLVGAETLTGVQGHDEEDELYRSGPAAAHPARRPPVTFPPRGATPHLRLLA